MNWQAGDKAVCIDKQANDSVDGFPPPADGGVKYGYIYLVDEVCLDYMGTWLGFTAYPEHIWHSNSFRKVVTATELAELELSAHH